MTTIAESTKERLARRAAASPDCALTVEQLMRRKIWEPHGAARKLWYCHDPEILLEGPAGTGKTRSILEKVHALCQKYANVRALLVRQTKESMAESVLVTYEDHVLPLDSPIAQGPNRHNRQVYSYPNGSEIVIGGLDKWTKIMSTEYDIICVFEATEVARESYEGLLTRCRNQTSEMPYTQMIADCNPGDPFHWLNTRPEEEIAVDPLDENSPTRKAMTRLRSRHTDNPTLWDPQDGEWTQYGRQYMATLYRLSGARRARLLHGQWVAAEGTVYEDVWDPAIHSDQPHPDPRQVRYYFISLDWGYRNPGVVLLWAVDNDDRMWCIKQIYKRYATVNPWWRDQILRIMRHFELQAVVCDPSEPGYIEEFRQAKIPVVEGNNDRKLGIQHVEERLKLGADGHAGLYYCSDNQIHRDEGLAEDGMPTCTEQEYSVYSYPKGEDGKPIKEDPLDMDDHGMDATRYGVMYADEHRQNRRRGGAVKRTVTARRRQNRRRRRAA